MHHLLYSQSQALDGEAELLLKQTYYFHKHAEVYTAYLNMPCCHTQEWGMEKPLHASSP